MASIDTMRTKYPSLRDTFPIKGKARGSGMGCILEILRASLRMTYKVEISPLRSTGEPPGAIR